MFLARLLVLAGVGTVLGQSCSNYGTLGSNGTCECSAGLTGSDCATLACSNPVLSSSSRTAFSPALSSNASQGCTSQCTAGFGGPTCNVCQTNAACATALGKGGASTASNTLGSPVCSAGAWTWTEGFASCDVVNPTLQDVFSGSTTLVIQKTVEPTQSLSSSIGTNGTLFAQLFYAASTGNTTIVEQFYCYASDCSQSNITSSSSPTVDYTCANLECTCIAGTAFCGGAGQKIDITDTINGLSGTLEIACAATGESCAFRQNVLKTLFGSGGLALSGCAWGECVLPATINSLSAALVGGTSNEGGGAGLSSGVIAGLAVLGGLLAALLVLLIVGFSRQQQARKLAKAEDPRLGSSVAAGSLTDADADKDDHAPPAAVDYAPPAAVGIRWNNLSYSLPPPPRYSFLPSRGPTSDGKSAAIDDGRLVLSSLSATLEGGSFCSILGPSGAGKSTLVDLLAGVRKTGFRGGSVELVVPAGAALGVQDKVRVGYVDQNDVLPETSTVREAIDFAAELKLGEIPKERKNERVFEVLSQLGLLDVADSLIGTSDSSGKRGISGGERRRVSIARELVARPAVLILDEPTSGLDSSSALRIVHALKSLTLPSGNRRATTVVLTIHQPSSQLFHLFNDVLLLSHGGEQLYFGRKDDVEDWFESRGTRCPHGFSTSDYMLDLASARQAGPKQSISVSPSNSPKLGMGGFQRRRSSAIPTILLKNENAHSDASGKPRATALTQVQVLLGRNAKELLRDRSLVLTHNVVPLIVGVIVGGMFFKVDTSIAGFQSRIGSLFFLGCLIAFSSLSALTHFSRAKPLFVRERARGYYHSLSWLASTVILDVVPLRIIPTILLGVIVYFMVGLTATAANFFKFLLILVLYTIATTLWNFFLAAAFTDVGVAILVSSILNLFQLAFAGFFLNLSRVPPVLRWLQWLAPLKFTLEALAVNEVGGGLLINDSLEGVRVSVSAELIMDTLFGFKATAYYRDVLVLVAFIVGFAGLLVAAVLAKMRELR